MNITHSIQPNQARNLVIGLGLTGYSVVKHLVKAGAPVTVADSREFPPYMRQVKDEFPAVELITGQIPYARFGAFEQVIVSPGIGIERQGVGQNTSNAGLLIGDIELFVRQVATPIIAITGSNGKSTVTMLVAEMLLAAGLKVKVGGNIGTPVLDLLDQTLPDYYVPDYYVLELSSFQLETTYSLRAAVATVLNISADHMDRYLTLEEYTNAKKRIFQNAHNVVVNRADVLASPGSSQVSTVSFGLDAPQDDTQFGVLTTRHSRALLRGTTKLAEVEQITLQGEQNRANILAAMALVKMAGVALRPCVIGAALNYGGLPHRCEIVAEVNGVKWINDSKGTNAGATIAAIEGFQQELVLIAGGKGKGADFSPLAEKIKQCVKHTILFGEDADIISESFDSSLPHTRVDLLEQAVMQAKKLARPGAVVLFSPACASFDMFDNYEHRGNVFKQLVLELVH